LRGYQRSDPCRKEATEKVKREVSCCCLYVACIVACGVLVWGCHVSYTHSNTHSAYACAEHCKQTCQACFAECYLNMAVLFDMPILFRERLPTSSGLNAPRLRLEIAIENTQFRFPGMLWDRRDVGCSKINQCCVPVHAEGGGGLSTETTAVQTSSSSSADRLSTVANGSHDIAHLDALLWPRQ
jgi:hypothetical protein